MHSLLNYPRVLANFVETRLHPAPHLRQLIFCGVLAHLVASADLFALGVHVVLEHLNAGPNVELRQTARAKTVPNVILARQPLVPHSLR